MARAAILPLYVVLSLLLHRVVKRLSSLELASLFVLVFAVYPPYVRYSFNPSSEYLAAALRAPVAFANLNWIDMATPCRKCGAEKTETAPHGLLYSLAKACGYRLRICSRCHRRRFLPLHRPRVDDLEEPETQREERGQTTPEIDPDVEAKPPGACPKCGKVDFRRSRRRSWERMIRRGPMVRCRACKTRFPMPKPDELAD